MNYKDLCNIIDVKSWLGIGIQSEVITIPDSPYQVTVSKAASYTSTIQLINLQDGSLLNQSNTPTTHNQYNVSQGVYTFASVDCGVNVAINYTIFSPEDIMLGKLITNCSTLIRTYTSNNFQIEIYDEIRSGYGHSKMMMTKNNPILNINSLTINNINIPAFPNNIDDSTKTGYFYTNSYIQLRGYDFVKGQSNVEISYVSGYENIPEDINQSCVELVAYKFRERDHVGQQSKSVSGQTVSYIIKDIPDNIKIVLDRYINVIPI
jgi:hypothetical protein